MKASIFESLPSHTFSTILWDSYYNPHFIDKVTEKQRGYITFLILCSQKEVELGLITRKPASRTQALSHYTTLMKIPLQNEAVCIFLSMEFDLL